jgi:hypothetical protein
MLAMGAGIPGPPHTRAIATSNNSTVKTVTIVKKRIFLVMLNPSVVAFEIFKATGSKIAI